MDQRYNIIKLDDEPEIPTRQVKKSRKPKKYGTQ